MERLDEIYGVLRPLLVPLGIGSAALFVASILAIPWLVARIPQTYFVRERRPDDPRPRAWIVALRSVVGIALVLMGVAMLVLPGQGILMILLGVMFLEFPGKRRLLLAAVRRKGVRRALQWLRTRRGRPPLDFPEESV